jgi:hypothetical protein
MTEGMIGRLWLPLAARDPLDTGCVRYVNVNAVTPGNSRR